MEEKELFGNLVSGDNVWVIKKDYLDAKKLTVTFVNTDYIDNWGRFAIIKFDKSYFQRYKRLTFEISTIEPTSCWSSSRELTRCIMYCNKEDAIASLEAKEKELLDPLWEEYNRCEDILTHYYSTWKDKERAKVRQEIVGNKILRIENRFRKLHEKL